MKLVKLYTRPENLDKVREKLFEMGAPGLSVTDALGIGKPLGEMAPSDGGQVNHLPQFRKRICVDVVAGDRDAHAIAANLALVCKTGSLGDGKVFIMDVDDAIRVRTGQRDLDALY